jgi:hypothetical protein
MGKRQRTKGQTTIYKTLHIKTKDRVTRTPLKTGATSCCALSDIALTFYIFIFFRTKFLIKSEIDLCSLIGVEDL